MTEMTLPVLYADDTAAEVTVRLRTRTGDLSTASRVDLLLIDRVLATDLEIVDQPVDGLTLVASWQYDGSLDPGEHVVWARATLAAGPWTSDPMRLYVYPSPGGP